MTFDDLDLQSHPFRPDFTLQAKVWFPNGYGASVVQGPDSYGGPQGLWELAITKGTKPHETLCYDTPITDDVLGHLTEADVTDLLARIEALEAAS